jgi:hypothetical protein
MSCRSALVSAAAAAVLVLASAAATFAVASPSAVTLHISDLPAGYRLYVAKPMSNAEIATHDHMTAAEFDRHGRITGLIETFRGSSPKLPTSIFADVHSFTSPAGATWDYKRGSANDLLLTRRVNVPRVGVASIGFLESLSAGKQKFYILGMDFHRGNYNVSVGVQGLVGYVRLGQVLRYARIVDGRIQRAK